MNKEERLQLENECLMKYSKAQMIEKYIDELEENSKLSELWCKSQEENQKYKEVIDKIQRENKILKENAENNGKVVDKVNWENMLLKKENKQLKDNWNYIKKMLKEARQEKYISGYCGTCTDVDIDFLLDKMQEIMGGDK